MSRDGGRSPAAHDAGTPLLQGGLEAGDATSSRYGGRRDERARIEHIVARLQERTYPTRPASFVRALRGCARPQCALTGRTQRPARALSPGEIERFPSQVRRLARVSSSRPTAPPRSGRYSPRLTRSIPP